MRSDTDILLHATCVSLGGHGVLLRGPSGSGKSDLALRLIEAGAMLVADDQVALQDRDGQLWATVPKAIAGLLEVRGIGVVRLAYRRRARVVALIDLLPAGQVERMPEPAHVEVAGVCLPRYTLEPFAASAAAKVRLMVRASCDVAVSADGDRPVTRGRR